jgi:hypothetical protein
VCSQAQEINFKPINVDVHLRGGLNRIGMNQSTCPVNDTGEFRKILNRSDLIVRQPDAHKQRVRPETSLQLRPTNPTRSIDWQFRNIEPSGSQRPCCEQDSVMLD